MSWSKLPMNRESLLQMELSNIDHASLKKLGLDGVIDDTNANGVVDVMDTLVSDGSAIGDAISSVGKFAQLFAMNPKYQGLSLFADSAGELVLKRNWIENNVQNQVEIEVRHIRDGKDQGISEVATVLPPTVEKSGE